MIERGIVSREKEINTIVWVERDLEVFVQTIINLNELLETVQGSNYRLREVLVVQGNFIKQNEQRIRQVFSLLVITKNFNKSSCRGIVEDIYMLYVLYVSKHLYVQSNSWSEVFIVTHNIMIVNLFYFTEMVN